jgi:hypothetical protein
MSKVPRDIVTTGLATRLRAEQTPWSVHEFQPRLFHPVNPEEAHALEELLNAQPDILLFDTIKQQILELLETRDPTTAIAAAQQAMAVARFLTGLPVELYGTWAYFPWNRHLIHILPEQEFFELRTSRNLYKITRPELAKLQKSRIGVVGLSVGDASARTLALESVAGELRLADFDTLSLSNMNRIFNSVENIGTNKTVLTARAIYELNPYAKIKIFPEGITDSNLDDFLGGLEPLTLLVEECDDLAMKVRLRERCRAMRIPVVMETSDRGLIDIERFDREPKRSLFHGAVGEIKTKDLIGLKTVDKVPLVLKILNAQEISMSLSASFIEVGKTIKTWPQLGSSVMLGGGVATDAIRRILLDQFHQSGRFYVDAAEIVKDGKQYIPPDNYVMPPPAEEESGRRQVLLHAKKSIDDMDIRNMVELALTAPSGGNCQPWQFIFKEGKLCVIHDVERSRSFLDFQHRASHLALGAAVENICIAASIMGFDAQLEMFPSAREPHWICAIHFVPTIIKRDDRHLLPYIVERNTNRKLGPAAGFAKEHHQALTEAAARMGAKLTLLTDRRELDKIGELLGANDRLRLLNPIMHRELVSEIRWSEEDVRTTRDGIDVATLEMSPADMAAVRMMMKWPVMQFVSKIQNGGKAIENMAENTIKRSSAVGLLTLASTGRDAFFQGGRALQRVWLEATAHNLGFQPVSSISYLFGRLVYGGGEGFTAHEVATLHDMRDPYVKLFGLREPVAELLLFRLAYTEPPTARALRRSVDDVLIIDER